PRRPEERQLLLAGELLERRLALERRALVLRRLGEHQPHRQAGPRVARAPPGAVALKPRVEGVGAARVEPAVPAPEHVDAPHAAGSYPEHSTRDGKAA